MHLGGGGEEMLELPYCPEVENIFEVEGFSSHWALKS